ncbi:bifunctional pyr operon transcriptional regulator/uracil phosphoribosyltransferase PyrR [Prochlorothrix hollandica]|uniref:Bifunctional protein PyrR n=1 Tax=Prochlorothrix hollandica PCC 9006 = CALU 1027 TaxID=317619 RepID=A0A0M2PQH6_PROHO|nr:bifunctional pyr operon transcriptional regulator/uracil phosphoribosyltransferase PyrR [Prochlorothrix hollandica]KKI98484.1 uracil phosphoribosyltransferase [Prochlorothrix hollandica PCC 9006 = CALU 1027]
MQPEVVEILSPEEIRRTCNRLASEIVEQAGDLSQIVLLGIYTRGVPLAQMLGAQIQALEGFSVAMGALDITLYRDDLATIGIRTPVKTHIDVDLTGRTVVLVDDVIFKGRTIRAALDAINDYGRPDRVRLAVLVDRGHRDLPIHPDFTGRQLPTAQQEQVKVYLKDIDGRDGVELIRPL